MSSPARRSTGPSAGTPPSPASGGAAGIPPSPPSSSPAGAPPPPPASAPRIIDRVIDENSPVGRVDDVIERDGSFLDRIKDRIYDTPLLAPLAGKLEIWYHRQFQERNEAVASGIKTEMEGIDREIQAYEKQISEAEKTAEQMKREGIPGGDRIVAEITRKNERGIERLKRRKDKLNEKLIKRNNRAERRRERMDIIADRVIDYYEERLTPSRRELADMERRYERASEEAKRFQSVVEEEEKRIAFLQENRLNWEEHLLSLGLSPEDVRRDPRMRQLDDLIGTAQTKIHTARKNVRAIGERMSEINEQINDMGERMHPYERRREQFVRIKERKKIDLGDEARKMPYGKRTDSIPERPAFAAKAEDSPYIRTSAEHEGRVPVDMWLDSFNSSIPPDLQISEYDFLNVTGLEDNTTMTLDYFLDQLRSYVRQRRLPLDDAIAEYDKTYRPHMSPGSGGSAGP